MFLATKAGNKAVRETELTSFRSRDVQSSSQTHDSLHVNCAAVEEGHTNLRQNTPKDGVFLSNADIAEERKVKSSGNCVSSIGTHDGLLDLHTRRANWSDVSTFGLMARVYDPPL